FGPVTPTFADEHLREVRQRGECLVFNAEGTVDVRLTPGETWSTLLGRLPGAWQPDCVALYLPYTTIPSCLWSAPVPVIGLAADWNLLFHCYRACLPLCDLVITGPVGEKALSKIGLNNLLSANLYG